MPLHQLPLTGSNRFQSIFVSIKDPEFKISVIQHLQSEKSDETGVNLLNSITRDKGK